MTSAIKVVVFDDDTTRNWHARISEALSGSEVCGYEVSSVPADLSAFGDLFVKLSEAAESGQVLDDELLDSADVVVVDSDINNSSTSDRKLAGRSGAHFAYLVRHYSRAGTTVVVNEVDATPVFDLRMNQFKSSPADFNIDEKSLVTPAFWYREAPSDGTYRPTHWTAVIKHVEGLRAALDATRPEQLDTSIEELLGLDAVGGQWTLSQRDSFADDSGQAMMTLRGVAERSYRAEVPLARIPSESDETHLLRVALFRLSQLVRRELLPPCNVVTDCWHLPALTPGSFFGDSDPRAALAKVREFGLGTRWDDLDALDGLLANLATTPIWATDDVMELSPEATQSVGEVLVEAESEFVERALATPFRHDLAGPLPVRYVRTDRGNMYDIKPMNRLGNG